MDKQTISAYLNLIRLKGTFQSYKGAVQPKDYSRVIVQQTQVSDLAMGFVGAGRNLFDHGEWFLDSRYSLLDGFDPAQFNVSEDHITVFKVADYGVPGCEGRTTLEGEPYTEHGGLYYVGKTVHRLLMASPTRRQALMDRFLVFADDIATRKRYPYPIIILATEQNAKEGHELFQVMHDSYKTWAPVVTVIGTHLGIREAHEQAISYFPEIPALIVDPDFEPNGAHELMYELKGGETDYVHLWHTRNRMNDAVYGHGSPKLMSHKSTDFSLPGRDMTMSIPRKGITIHPHVVGVHGFDRSPDTLWRTVYREVTKLMEMAKAGDSEAGNRLDHWLTMPPDPIYVHAIRAATAGHDVDINDYAALDQLKGQTA